MTLVLGRVQERLGRPLARCEHPNGEAVHNASGADREGEVVIGGIQAILPADHVRMFGEGEDDGDMCV